MGFKRPVQPDAPSGMEIIFTYRCPFCGCKAVILAPLQPGRITCESCQKIFPIIPVDERTIRYIKTMLASGKAAVDPDFI